MSKENINKKPPIIYLKKEHCMGCYACFSVCPVFAITMESDYEGFEYPIVNSDKCIKCYKCENVCPTRELFSRKTK